MPDNLAAALSVMTPGSSAQPWQSSLPRAEREFCAARRSRDRLLARQAARAALVELGVTPPVRGQIEIRRGQTGRPAVWMSGRTVDALEAPTSTTRYSLSLAHDREIGVAAALRVPSSTPAMTIGVDVIALHRVRRWTHEDIQRLRRHVLAAREMEGSTVDDALACARVIAAKEAIGKAIRHHDDSVRWKDVRLRPEVGSDALSWNACVADGEFGGIVEFEQVSDSLIARTIHR